MAAPLTGRRAYFCCLFLVLASGFLGWLLERGREDILPAGDLDRLPLKIGDWSGEDIPVSARDRAILGTDNLLLRLYRQGDRFLYLYILECSSNRASFHPPKYCYVGGRTEMVERGQKSVEWAGGMVPAHRMVFLGPRGKSLVYYWYTYGETILGDYYRQQLLIIGNILLGEPRPALLVRVSVEGAFDPEIGDEMVADFARSLLPALEQYLLKSDQATDY
ncbi:MAG: EpsI family protein [Candidatus Erginobacter occultus]|nr:EpsI family protein [Candidatus Erginobacter occultus]